ncbi:MAG: hypothetical protein ABIL09_01670 [Gemmatimonadota bacterium]
MLNPFGNGKKRKARKAFDPREVIQRLTELMPPSTLVYMTATATGREVDETLGRAVFLQRDQKVYYEGPYIYMSTPEGLKASEESAFRGRGEILSMQFLHRRVPYKFECRVVGRFRLLPEIVETLDFRLQSAYKLQPVTRIRKEEKRHYLRYTVNNYGNPRVPITTHVNFDVYADLTNQQLTSEGAPPVELNNLRVVPRERPDTSRQFDASVAVDEVRKLLLENPSNERQVHLTKVVKSQALRSGRRTPEEVFYMGSVNILGLEKELVRPVLYTRKSPKYDGRRDNPYDLRPHDRVLMHFRSKEDYYEVLCECQEARVQNEVLRPVAWPVREGGLRLSLVEYSVGGAMVEGCPDLLKMLLGRACPPDVDQDPSYEGRFWERVFEELQKPLIQLTFYPRLHFTEKLEQFRPELPYKIFLVAHIVRTHMHHHAERQVLQHGLRFVYDPQGVPLTWHEAVHWKLIRGVRDNAHFTEIHSKLSLLYGFLEHRKQTVDSLEGRAPPRRRPAPAS